MGWSDGVPWPGSGGSEVASMEWAIGLFRRSLPDLAGHKELGPSVNPRTPLEAKCHSAACLVRSAQTHKLTGSESVGFGVLVPLLDQRYVRGANGQGR